MSSDRGRPIAHDEEITNSGYLRLNSYAREQPAALDVSSNSDGLEGHGQIGYSNPYNNGGYGGKSMKMSRQTRGSIGELTTEGPQDKKYQIDYSNFGQIEGQKTDQFTVCYHCTKCCRNPESSWYRCEKIADQCDKNCSPLIWCCVLCPKLCPGS